MKNGFKKIVVALVALVAQSSIDGGYKLFFGCTLFAQVAQTIFENATSANFVQLKKPSETFAIKGKCNKCNLCKVQNNKFRKWISTDTY